MGANDATTRPAITAQSLGQLGPVTITSTELKDAMLGAAPTPATASTILGFSSLKMDKDNQILVDGEKIGVNVIALAMDNLPKQALAKNASTLFSSQEPSKGPGRGA